MSKSSGSNCWISNCSVDSVVNVSVAMVCLNSVPCCSSTVASIMGKFLIANSVRSLFSCCFAWSKFIRRFWRKSISLFLCCLSLSLSDCILFSDVISIPRTGNSNTDQPSARCLHFLRHMFNSNATSPLGGATIACLIALVARSCPVAAPAET